MKRLIRYTILCMMLDVGVANAMRCGNDVITEGDSAGKLSQCETPTYSNTDVWNEQSVYEIRKNDGSVYTVHVLNNVIQSIEMSRE